jgi:nicotine blue oxidoreductase
MDRPAHVDGQVAGLVLAAGAGRRYGRPKAPVLIDGERLVDRAVRNLRDGGCAPVLVVLGAWVGDVPGARVVVNDEWEEGMGSSLRAGLRAVDAHEDVQSVVVTLVDLPGLTPEAVRRLVDSYAALAAATYAGKRGHPVRFARDHWAAIIEVARADEGARGYLRGRPDIELIEVGDVASGQDLDEPGE